MVNSVCSSVWYRTRTGIYGNVYLGSRVLHATWHIYVYIRNLHVHIVWYKAATPLLQGEIFSSMIVAS